MRLVLLTILLAGLAGGGAAAEDRREMVEWDGRQRSYVLHLPPATGPLPLVVALHGAGQDADSFAWETRFGEAADAAAMAVVFPDGSGPDPQKRTWNAHFCCGAAINDHVDDIGFIGALIERLAATPLIDRRRIYATGISNGGMLVYQLAAAHPEWFAAIAPVSATIGGTNRNGERFVIDPPARPVPVMIIHGRRDPYVLFAGGSSALLSFPKRSNMAVADALHLWTAADGCAAPPEISEPVVFHLRRSVWAGCGANSTVVLWEIEDGEHNWPAEIAFPAPGGGTRNAAAEILAFFAPFQRR
jgi:polyhydroxybutyrate depolymerase